jgi:hypothetical protein
MPSSTSRARASYTARVTEERTPDLAPPEEAGAVEPSTPTAAGPVEPAPAVAPHPAVRFFRKHRSRIFRVALIALAVVVLLDLSQSLPTETTVELELGERGASAIALHVEVLDASGEPARVVRLAYPDGVPAHVTETLDLAPGHYRVRVDAEHADGSHDSLEGSLEAPAEGTVHVALRPVP